MSEEEYLQNCQLGLEEAGRNLRYIDNLFWLISSFTMIATGFGVSKAFYLKDDKWQIVMISVAMILKWILYLYLKKNIRMQSNYYLERAIYYQKELHIKAYPEHKSEITGGIQFDHIMFIIAWSSIALWIFIFIKACSCDLFGYNVFNLCSGLLVKMNITEYNI